MKTSFHSILVVLVAGGLVPLADLHAQGVIEARLTMGERVTELRYSRQGDMVRIEELRATAPSPPVTLLNLKTGDATLCVPHNATFLRIPAARLAVKPDVSGPPMPAAGPSAAFPAMPQLPAMPPLPAFPGPFGQPAAAKLEHAGETRLLHGIQCAKHTAIDPEEGTLEVWAADEWIPFYLPLQEAPRNHRPLEWVEAWPDRVREQDLFPMLAALRVAGRDTVMVRFEVTALDLEKEGTGPFEVPENFHETAPSAF